MSRRTSIALALAFAAAPLTAQQIQPMPQVGTVQPYSFVSKTTTNNTQDLLMVDQHVIRRAGASFLQLEFANVKLSEESILEIESLTDGDKQTIDFETWDPKNPHSYYFNGDAVKVTLWAGRGASGDRFSIQSIGVGTKDVMGPLTICGSTDDRVPSADRRVARILIRRGTSIGVCTAWLYSANNCFATAGHCLNPTPSLVTAQFNVPASTSTGAIRNPPTSSQYNWTGARYFSDRGRGNDWGVFTTRTNTSTRRHAGAVQNSWFRFSSSLTSSTRITGCGSDTSPRSRNFTQQTHSGPTRPRIGNILFYRADTMGGNSGSPVMNSSGFAIGVHTHGGCNRTSSTSANAGTWQGHSDFVRFRNLLCKTVDLRVDALSGPSAVVNGMTYSMSTRIRNYGTGPSTTCTSGLYISTNNIISTGDTLLRSFTTPALSSGASYTYSSSTVRIPTSVRPGTCYLGALADSNDVNGEVIETNNYRTKTMSCRGNLPNLAPLAVQVSSSTLVAGGSYTFGCRMHNTGSATAVSSRTGIYLSTNNIISTGDRLLAAYTTPQLNAGANVNQNTRFSVPTNVQNGTCYLGAYADYLRRITEGSESDNDSRALTVRCVGRPDLVITAISTTSGTTWNAGGIQTVSVTVRNAGPVASAATTGTIHLTPSTSVTPTSYYLGSFSIPSLAPSASVIRRVSVRHPWCYRATTRWYLGAYVDTPNRIAEVSEANNGRVITTPRTLRRYTGSGRFAEFVNVRYNNSNGPTFYNSATFRARLGARTPICVTAPRYNNYWVFPIWSASSGALQIDALTNLSISLPLYIAPITQVKNNYADFSFNLPRVPGFTGSINAYMHTVWFTPTFSGLNSLSGTNRLLHRIIP